MINPEFIRIEKLAIKAVQVDRFGIPNFTEEYMELIQELKNLTPRLALFMARAAIEKQYSKGEK